MSEEQFKAAFDSKQHVIGWAYIILASLSIAVSIGGIIINIIATVINKIN